MPDLDYVTLVGRFGIVVGDGADPDDEPDVIWCDEGEIRLVPLNGEVKIAAGSPVPWTAGIAVVDASIDTDGYLSWRGKQFIQLVDLTSDKVNPTIPANKATHRVEFRNVKADSVPVTLTSATVRIAADTVDIATGTCDLTKLLPVQTGNPTPIYSGPRGTGITDIVQPTPTTMALELTDGTTTDPIDLPVGPGGSDAGVAGYLATPGSLTAGAVAAKIATVSQTLYPISGESVTATTARINAALAAGSDFGTRRTIKLVGDFTHNAPLVVPSDTTFDTEAAVLTLAANSLSNGIINKAVVDNRRVMDAVTTAASTTLTSASAAFVSGDVGRTITVWNPATPTGRHITTIASRTNATTVVLTDPVPTTGTAQYASIGSRDKNIVLRLGRLVRATPNYVAPANGWRSNHVRLRHLDGFEVSVLDVETYSGKYAVNPGDCTKGRIPRVFTSTTNSDLFHLNGPCSRILIDEVVSEGSGDDIVSLTGGDFTTIHQMADCQGDITDINIGVIRTRPSIHAEAYTRALLILAGRNADQTIQYKCARIEVDWVDSQLTGWPVFIGGDSQDNNTQGGVYEDITIYGGINRTTGTPPPGFVRARDSVITNLNVGHVQNKGGAADVRIESAATVVGLKLNDTLRSRVSNAGSLTYFANDQYDSKFTKLRGNRVALLGDSITDNNYSLSGESTLWGQSSGYFIHANQMLGQRFDLVYQSATDPEFGQSGATTTSLVDGGHVDALIAAKPDWAFLMVGVNDLTNSTAGQGVTIFNRWKNITDKIMAAGIPLVVGTVPPRGVVSDTSAVIANHHDLNQRIKNYAMSTPGVILCDWYNVLADATTGRQNTAFFGDDVHPNPVGARRLGRFLADILDPLFPKFDRRPALGDPANLSPSSWTTANSNATNTPSTVASSDSDPRSWTQINCTAISSTDAGSYSRILKNATVAEGEKYYATVQFETDAASWNVKALYLMLRTTGPANAVYDGYNVASSIVLERTPSGVFRTPVLTVPAGVTQLQMEFRQYGIGTSRVRADGIMKVV